MAKRILVEDDERDIVEMLDIRLQENGYEVFAVYDGLDALTAARTQRPDLILLDYTLPKKNGVEICRELKSDGELKHIPVILLSAYQQDQIDRHHLADAYVTKPYHADKLLLKIATLLASSAPAEGRSQNPP